MIEARKNEEPNKMIQARPVFRCGDCDFLLPIDDLEKNICSNCQAELCQCICHIGNFSDCEECASNHEGK